MTFRFRASIKDSPVAQLSEPCVTASEAVTVLRRLEPRLTRDLTDRRFRYAAEATGAAKAGRGWTMLYGSIDLALVRLMLRLETEISIPVARFTTGYLASEIRGLLQSARPVAAVLVVPLGDEARYPRRAWPRLMSDGEIRRLGLRGVQIPLRQITAGIAETMAAVAEKTPTVRLFQPMARSTATVRVLERVELVGV
jgi:hypothetical protein